MPNADGSIVVKATVDDQDAEKRLKKLNRTIESTESKLSKLEKSKLPMVEEAERLTVELDKAKYTLANMESKKELFSTEQIKEQRSVVSMIQKDWNSIQTKIENTDKKINSLTEELTEAKTEAGGLEKRMTTAGYRAGRAMDEAGKRVDKFKLRLREVIRSALVFTLITQSLAKFREWMGKVIKTNSEATAAVARLKGALLTLAQPLVNVIIPAFTALVNVLTAVVGEVAKIVSGLFGSTIDQSAEAAENLQAEADALEATGGAAKKAGKSLASFDEINKLSSASEGGGGGASDVVSPDFSWADGVTEQLERIAKAVMLIGAGFALWKIGSSLPGMLGTIMTKLGGILVFLGGLVLAYEGFTDAWKNGVDWGNLAMMIGGVAAAAAGLYTVFGKIGAGIALVVGGVAMLVTGFKDVIANGANLKNTLLIIAGIIATGLGIALLTGNLIPALIAGILAIITAVISWQGNLEGFAEAFVQIFNGIIDFFKGVFTGDMELAWRGIQNVVIGAINAIIIAFESFVNAAIDGLNWLIEKANSVADAVGIKKTLPTIPRIEIPTIPYLAQGAVIPPNREFMAVLGDQKSGTNIETPLDTMIEAFRTAVRDMNVGWQNEAVLVLDDEVLGKVVYKMYNKENRRIGVSFSG